MSNTAQLPAPVQPKAPVTIGRRGVELNSLEELYRFAQCISKSGFAPKGMESPESITVAIEMGLELGLTPMQSVQNIAVINGRPSVWGDVPLALARASGVMEIFEEYFEHDGKRVERPPVTLNDTTTGVCRLKRVNQAPHTSCFSVADAKRAGLWGKQGPWSQYPLRMLQMRARGFALRDQLGDFLKGLITREEAQDIDADPVKRAKNVTPTAPVAEIPQATREVDDGEGTDLGPQTSVVQSPQDQLAAQITSEGISFDTFKAWMIQTSTIDESVVCDDFSMIPTQTADALLAKPKVLNPAIKMMKAGGVK